MSRFLRFFWNIKWVLASVQLARSAYVTLILYPLKHLHANFKTQSLAHSWGPYTSRFENATSDQFCTLLDQGWRKIHNGEGLIFIIYSCSASLISFEIDCFYSVWTRLIWIWAPQLSIFRRSWTRQSGLWGAAYHLAGKIGFHALELGFITKKIENGNRIKI